MPDREYLARSVHDLAAAAWFGGSLMGAVGVNGAAAAARDPRERIRLSGVGWGRWTPVEAAALLAHGAAGAWLARQDRDRRTAPEGTARSAAKAVVTAAGAATSIWGGVAGRRAYALSGQGGRGATEPRAGAPARLASAQRQLKVLQWVNPALAGAVIVLGARRGG